MAMVETPLWVQANRWSGLLDPTLSTASAAYNGPEITASGDINTSQGTYRTMAKLCDPCFQGGFGMNSWLAAWSFASSATSSLLPGSVETDGDGLTDDEEVNTFGTKPNLADTDGDSMNDGLEVAFASSGFDPTVNRP